MAQQRIDIIIRVLDKTAGTLNQVNKKIGSITDAISMSQRKMKGWKTPLQEFNKDISKTSGQMITFDKHVNNTSKSLDRTFGKAQLTKMRKLTNAILGAGLSMLFTGMAIKKAAETALRGIMTTYKEAMAGSGEFIELTGRLSAAWTYFKFSLMDALMQTELFPALMEGLIGLLDILSSMPDWVKNLAIGFLVFALVVGGVMMFLGQTFLAVLGILGMILLPILFVIFAIVLIVVFAIIVLIGIWGSGMSKTEKILWTVVVVLIAIALILFVLGMAGVAVWFLIIAAVVIVIALIVKYWDEIKEFFIKLWDSLVKVVSNAGIKIKDTFLKVINYLKGVLIDYINVWIMGINKIIELMNKILPGGVKIGTIDLFDGGNYTVPEYATGGYVPTTGPAILHAGEYVLNRDQVENGVSGGVNVGDINISVMGETTDAERLAELVSEQIMNEFQRYAG